MGDKNSSSYSSLLSALPPSWSQEGCHSSTYHILTQWHPKQERRGYKSKRFLFLFLFLGGGDNLFEKLPGRFPSAFHCWGAGHMALSPYPKTKGSKMAMAQMLSTLPAELGVLLHKAKLWSQSTGAAAGQKASASAVCDDAAGDGASVFWELLSPCYGRPPRQGPASASLFPEAALAGPQQPTGHSSCPMLQGSEPCLAALEVPRAHRSCPPSAGAEMKTMRPTSGRAPPTAQPRSGERGKGSPTSSGRGSCLCPRCTGRLGSYSRPGHGSHSSGLWPSTPSRTA